MCSKTQLFKPFQTPLEICADIRTSGVQNDVCVRHTYYYLKYVLIDKAMKSRPFGNLKFCRFSLLKIKIGWVLSCIKVQICKQSYCELMHSCLLFTNLNFDTS